MPLFISYSHQDKEFVDKLAIQLVRQNVHVWLDRWELSIGDSLLDKVQEAVEGASALLVILSKASVASQWCKKELTAGLLRELEEKRVVVLPVLLEDCDIPIFARGKFYADFRTDFDAGLKTILEGVAKVMNASLGRTIEATYHTDWSIDWGDVEGQTAILLNFVQTAEKQPYTCLTNIEVLANSEATGVFEVHKKSVGIDHAKLHVANLLDTYLAEKNVKTVLSDEREKIYKFIVEGAEGREAYSVRIGVRRLGEDTGRDILVNTSGMVHEIVEHMNAVLTKPKS